MRKLPGLAVDACVARSKMTELNFRKILFQATEGFLLFRSNSRSDSDAQLAAIGRALAVIEFALDGTIITANKNFLDALGYRLDEIKGKPHSTFVPPSERDSAEYRAFWAALKRGEA